MQEATRQILRAPFRSRRGCRDGRKRAMVARRRARQRRMYVAQKPRHHFAMQRSHVGETKGCGRDRVSAGIEQRTTARVGQAWHAGSTVFFSF